MSYYHGETKFELGKTYQAKCLYNNGYEHTLVVGKDYTITIEEGMFDGPSNYYAVYSNHNKKGICHAYRFDAENACLVEEPKQ